MTMNRFIRLINTYGAGLHRWPEQDRTAARAWLERSPEARARLAAAAALDAAIADSAGLPDAATLGRMHDAIARHVARTALPARRGPGLRSWIEPLMQMGCGALVMLAVCFSLLSWADSNDQIILATAPHAFTLAEGGF